MPLFRSKPVLVEAMQVNQENKDDVARWCGGVLVKEKDAFDSSQYYVGVNVPSLSGTFRVSEPNWLVRMPDGSFKEMSDDRFREEFERVGTR